MNPTGQAIAIRLKAGWIQPFPRGILSVRGKDRIPFLHRLLSHDIKSLPIGQGRAACLLDRHGRIVFSCVVHSRPEQILLEMEPNSLATARSCLEKYLISEAVELEDGTTSFCLMSIHGPRIQNWLASCWPELAIPTASLQHREGTPGSGISFIVRWDLLGMPGLTLWVEPSSEPQVVAQLERVRESHGFVRVSMEMFHGLRIEAGVPWPGQEITESVILNELGLEEWASLTKGCFVGQEIVARIRYRAHPPRLLTGFYLEGETLPAAGTPLLLGTDLVGTLTSVGLSPTLGRPIALGFLKFGLEAGTFRAEGPEGSSQATVAKLPFVPPLTGIEPPRP